MLKQVTMGLGLAILVLSFSGMSKAAEATNVVDRARAECKSLGNGKLTTTESAITLADLTGDGRPEEIVDSRQFSCSSSASLFCGTGGCQLTVIVNEKPHNYLAKGWKIIHWDKQPVLLLAVHGADCGGTNLRKCFRALVWSDGGFRGLGGK